MIFSSKREGSLTATLFRYPPKLQTFVFLNNSETSFENYKTSDRKAGVGSNGALCKKPVVISSVYLNTKSALPFPTKSQTFVLQNNKKKSQNGIWLWNGGPNSLPLFCEKFPRKFEKMKFLSWQFLNLNMKLCSSCAVVAKKVKSCKDPRRVRSSLKGNRNFQIVYHLKFYSEVAIPGSPRMAGPTEPRTPGTRAPSCC